MYQTCPHTKEGISSRDMEATKLDPCKLIGKKQLHSVMNKRKEETRKNENIQVILHKELSNKQKTIRPRILR
jgi:hypothetical protein